MQEKVNKMTKIKERIIYFVENQRIKKGLFFEKIDVSSANFRGNAINTPLNSTTIENIITNYPQLNLHWLITGKGEMLNNKLIEPLIFEEPKENYGKTEKIEVDLLIKNNSLLKEQNQLQEEVIIMLREKVQFFEEKYNDCENQKKLLATSKKMD